MGRWFRDTIYDTTPITYLSAIETSSGPTPTLTEDTSDFLIRLGL